MLKIKLGYWQNIMAGESMKRAREIMKQTGSNLSNALKAAWKEIKAFISDLSLSYKEYKTKLYINTNNRVNTYEVTGSNLEVLMENLLVKISEVKGKTFYQNMCKWFMRKYDSALKILENRRKYSFMDGIWCIMELNN